MKLRIGLCIVVVIAFTWLSTWKLEFAQEEHKCIPTPFELQENLCTEGYEVEIDGIIGTKTMQAWNLYSNNKWYEQFHTESGAKE